MLVDRAVYVSPHSVDFDVGLVDEPPVAWRVPAESGGVGHKRDESLHPPEHGHVIDLDATLEQQFLNVAIGEIEPQVPADRDHDHLGREPEPGKRRLR